MTDGPFESLESAHDYVNILVEQVKDVEASLQADLAAALAQGHTRHLDALRLVDYKLHQLDHHLNRSSRLLNDLRALRRLLLEERASRAVIAH
jgi:hypothetical protein